MADTNVNYFDMYDQESRHLFVHNAFTERDANELYLVEGGDPKIYNGELLKRVDASSDYTRDGLPFLPVEHVPMPDQYVRRVEPYLQFEVNHRQVLKPEPYDVLYTTTEMNQDLNTYLDGVKVNNQNILPNQKRAMVMLQFNKMVENAISYGGSHGVRFLEQAYHYLLTEAPELYDVLLPQKEAFRSKLKTITPKVHDQISKSERGVKISPEAHEKLAKTEIEERKEEIAAISGQRRKSVAQIIEEKEVEIKDRAADILGSRLGRSLHDHMDKMHHNVLKQMAAKKGLRARNIRKDALIKSIILHHGRKNDLPNLGRELADKPVLGRVVERPCPEGYMSVQRREYGI